LQFSRNHQLKNFSLLHKISDISPRQVGHAQ